MTFDPQLAKEHLAKLLPTLKLLEQYDKGQILNQVKTQKTEQISIQNIDQVTEITKILLTEAGEPATYFGLQKDSSLEGIIQKL
jgi:hypothetical protein